MPTSPSRTHTIDSLALSLSPLLSAWACLCLPMPLCTLPTVPSLPPPSPDRLMTLPPPAQSNAARRRMTTLQFGQMWEMSRHVSTQKGMHMHGQLRWECVCVWGG